MPFHDHYLSRHVQISGSRLTQTLDELLHQALPEHSPNSALYRDMLLSVIRMAQTDHSHWDAQILLQTIQEMERAFHHLDRFKRQRKVTVFGSSRTPKNHPLYAQAKALGAALAHQDLMVITGAGKGIMEAAHEGAGLEYSLGLNILLPYEQHVNSTVAGTDNLLTFHFFFIRKLFFVKEADALVLCPGGFGTLDEALEVLTLVQTGKSPIVPIILLDEPGGTYWTDLLRFMEQHLKDHQYIVASDFRLMRQAYSVEEVVSDITNFYTNFHSSRWLDERFVIRLQHKLSETTMDYLNREYRDLCLQGTFEQTSCCSIERDDEPELQHLTRLSFISNGKHQGRLRELIDCINHPERWA